MSKCGKNKKGGTQGDSRLVFHDTKYGASMALKGKATLLKVAQTSFNT